MTSTTNSLAQKLWKEFIGSTLVCVLSLYFMDMIFLKHILFISHHKLCTYLILFSFMQVLTFTYYKLCEFEHVFLLYGYLTK